MLTFTLYYQNNKNNLTLKHFTISKVLYSIISAKQIFGKSKTLPSLESPHAGFSVLVLQYYGILSKLSKLLKLSEHFLVVEWKK